MGAYSILTHKSLWLEGICCPEMSRPNLNDGKPELKPERLPLHWQKRRPFMISDAEEDASRYAATMRALTRNGHANHCKICLTGLPASQTEFETSRYAAEVLKQVTNTSDIYRF